MHYLFPEESFKTIESIRYKIMNISVENYEIYSNSEKTLSLTHHFLMVENIKSNFSFIKEIDLDSKVIIPEIGFLFKLEKIDFSEFNKNEKNCIFLDSEKISFPLILRSRKNKDRFIPFGMKGTKKIKDFLIELKIPQRLRNRVVIVESAGKIAGVITSTAESFIKDRISENFKATQNSSVIKLSWERINK